MSRPFRVFAHLTTAGGGVVSAAALWAAIAVAAAQQPPPQQPPPQQEPPRFRASVDVTSLDVSVVDDHGKPFLGLKPEDFNVRIDGNTRRVVSAEWISIIADKRAPGSSQVTDLGPAFSCTKTWVWCRRCLVRTN